MEVADFSYKQIAYFVDKWFTCYDSQEQKAEKFMRKLNNNDPIQELASR